MANDVPLVLIEDGYMFHDRMKKSRVSEDDILERAREQLGLERLDQIKYAVLERSGGISIIPKWVPWTVPEDGRRTAIESPAKFPAHP